MTSLVRAVAFPMARRTTSLRRLISSTVSIRATVVGAVLLPSKCCDRRRSIKWTTGANGSRRPTVCVCVFPAFGARRPFRCSCIRHSFRQRWYSACPRGLRDSKPGGLPSRIRCTMSFIVSVCWEGGMYRSRFFARSDQGMNVSIGSFFSR